MFKFKNEAEGKTKSENVKHAKAILEALENKVDVIRSLEVGINSEEADQANFDLVLVTDFDSIDHLNEYQIHPDHQEVGKFIRQVIEGRACVDYTI
jgi:hypothetical protein